MCGRKVTFPCTLQSKTPSNQVSCGVRVQSTVQILGCALGNSAPYPTFTVKQIERQRCFSASGLIDVQWHVSTLHEGTAHAIHRTTQRRCRGDLLSSEGPYQGATTTDRHIQAKDRRTAMGAEN